MSVIPLNGRSTGRNSHTVKRNVIASLDIGSTKISCFIAEHIPSKHKMTGGALDRGSLKFLGIGHQLSRGVRGGSIVDIDGAERAIRLAVDAAERMAQVRVSSVYVNVSGGRPQSQSYTGKIACQSGMVSPRDVDNVLAVALKGVDIGRRKILHLAPIGFTLDDAQFTRSPLGMHGNVIGVEVGVVTLEPAHLQNLTMAVERAHLSVAGFVIAPYAAARAALVDDEFTLGTVVVDLGGATTGISVFMDGGLVYADLLPVGGQHVTNDIARGLTTTIAHAERMKTLWGSAIGTSNDERDMLAVPLLGERGVDSVQKVPKSTLTRIIRPRLEEIFELVQAKLADPALARFAGCRVVLTGGGSHLTGICDLANLVLGRQVRLGIPAPMEGMPELARSSGFSVAAGLLAYALKPDVHYSVPEQAVAAFHDAQSGYVKRVGRWLAESL
jgi:cell division protein FtsA